MWAWHLKTEPDLNASLHWVVRKGRSLSELHDWRKKSLCFCENQPKHNGMFLDGLNLTAANCFWVSKPGL